MTANTLIVRFPVVLCILLLLFVGSALGQETKLRWFGPAAFSVTTPSGKVLLIDPWLTNPANPDGVHSSSVFNPKEAANDAERVYGGNPGDTITFRGNRIIQR